ncbi:dicarboxylic amino acid permease [Histoplasma capsulatum]|uniref:Dicarboxylic amino acid permease n=1 Tax=Ajellomyces capsulatus TaxID=5037 RepID=A0A8A1M0Z9_AJECA|nr:amino acid permease Dip5 [Histoplasma mississippiense (nom. inval.)]EDN02757.1 amino acid permease Dip5 [Histoplasma mississippiense (nom. inval.)]QSS58344.1 dicarboxylic amino acid permease [Histoplasma capsulatum]
MAIWNRKADAAFAENQVKNEEYIEQNFSAEPDGVVDEDEKGIALHRGLKARHITMIAIGGAIGTGLIIGTGSALAKAGPASVLISYSIVGFIVYIVMCALGEMAAWLPIPSSFTGYAVRFCDPALGFALGYSYYCKYVVVTPNQLTAAALVLSYWVDRDRVNPGVWIAVFLVTIVCINYFGIRFFGEFEFWLSSFKVIVIISLILLSLVLALGGGPDHDRKGFRYWKDPGAFNTYIREGSAGRFLAFWSTMVTATFAFLGTELVGVTVGEAQNPRKTIPRAIKLTFFRILIFYILSVFLLGMLVPYNSRELAFATKASNSAAASPYVVAIHLAGIKVLPGILNGCILIFVFSASNSDLYIATRTIYGLAREGKAPRILARTDRRGVPIYALGLSSLFALIAFMNVSNDTKVVFGYFVNLVTIFGLLTWISILVTHIYFIRARKAQNVPESSLAYKAPFGSYGSYGALAFCILISLTKSFEVFVHNEAKYGKFDYKSFITAYIGIPLYLSLIFGYKYFTKCKRVKPHEADLWTGKDKIDREEAEFLARKAAQTKNYEKAGFFYRTFVSWLF